jgi:BirA family transcriptional regulator, biotin operon repressor / biotin---[acetyl-CoA-carboxylase] ligase
MSAGLDAAKIKAALWTRLVNYPLGRDEWPGLVSVRPVTESTNDDAFHLGQDGAPHGTAVFAEEQRAGRGRRGSRWSAPPGRNLTFSVVLRPALTPERWSRVAQATALAVARAVEPWLLPWRVAIKWPNDICVDARKLAGILVEAHPRRSGSFLVVGIGLNVNSTPEEFAAAGLEREVTSMASLSDRRELDRNGIAGALLAELGWQVKRSVDGFGEMRNELRERSWLLGKRVCVWRGKELLQGEAVDLGANGELLVRADESGQIEEILSADLVRLV